MIYKRILIKLSGESLLGNRKYGIDADKTKQIANELKEIFDKGIEIALVIGGGNIFRGKSAAKNGFDRATADYMGMLATVINALAMQDALEKIGIPTRVMSAINMPSVAEPFIRRKAIRHLEKRRIVILAAGTGHPYFSTDSNATLRALELHCEILIKATNVDGVYDRDPAENKSAKLYSEITIQEALEKNLSVMDASALALARDNGLKIVVFNYSTPGNLIAVSLGEKIGTTVIPK